MTLKDKLETLKIQVEDQVNLFNHCVTERLKSSQENYQKLLEKNCIYIMSRNNLKIIRALDKYQKRRDKDGQETKFGFIEFI